MSEWELNLMTGCELVIILCGVACGWTFYGHFKAITKRVRQRLKADAPANLQDHRRETL